jgi:DNA-binding FadR family transcriptional regulator
MLERDAAGLAAQRRNDADLDAIEKALRRRSAADPEADDQEFLAADAAFHQSVVAATHNRVLIELYDHLADPLRASVAEVLRATDERLDEVHQAVASAIRDGDPAAAEQSATDLLAASMAALGPR